MKNGDIIYILERTGPRVKKMKRTSFGEDFDKLEEAQMA